MKTCIFVYNGFTHFEVMITSLLMKSNSEIIVAGLDKSDVVSFEGFTIKPDTTLTDISLSDLDLFVIPGGTPEEIYDNYNLLEALQYLNNQNILIAAICAGPLHLARAGILDGKKFTVDNPEYEKYNQDFANGSYLEEIVVKDGNIITAKPTGYIDFALEIGRALDIFENEKAYQETAAFFKQ